MDLQGKIEVAKSDIFKNFLFLKSFGYEDPVIKIEDSELLRQWMDMKYYNPEIKRWLVVSYFPFKFENDVDNSFAVSFVKETRDSVVESNYLSFEIFLAKHCGISDNIFVFNISDGKFEDQVNGIMNKLIFLLKEYAFDLISGSRWENDCYVEW